MDPSLSRSAGGGLAVGSLIDEAAAALAAAGFDESRRRARRIVGAALGLSAGEVFAHPERPLDRDEAARIEALLARVLAHEPISRIFGMREFWGLEFRLSADTLDPRPETETVVELVLARLPDRTQCYRLLDLGTGSGCVLLALMSECRAAIGIGVDIAPGAALAARDNAAALGLGERARFVVGNWGTALRGPFDIIVANPPYVPTAAIPGLPPEVREHDPAVALDGGGDGLNAYRAIASGLERLLVPGGLFAAEIGAGQDQAVAAILTAARLAVEGVEPDLAGIGRCIVARRTGWS
jgi:release factor glutamine methyltransferase